MKLTIEDVVTGEVEYSYNIRCHCGSKCILHGDMLTYCGRCERVIMTIGEAFDRARGGIIEYWKDDRLYDVFPIGINDSLADACAFAYEHDCDYITIGSPHVFDDDRVVFCKTSFQVQ